MNTVITAPFHCYKKTPIFKNFIEFLFQPVSQRTFLSCNKGKSVQNRIIGPSSSENYNIFNLKVAYIIH